MNPRVQKLLSKMEKEGIDTLFITDEKNMYYYSGFYRGEGYIVINKDRLTVVTDSRYTEYASMVCKGFDVVNIASSKPSDFAKKGDICGFEDKSISYLKYREFASQIDNLKPIGDMTDSLRQIKDEGEIELIKRAAHITDMAFSHICSFIAEGVTEKEIAAEIDCFMLKNGAEESAFSTIAASGSRASLPHAIPTDEKVKKGDFIVLDYGCVIDGYRSDMTRTVAVGSVSDEKKDIYGAVLTSQLMALDSLRSGLTGADVDKVARDYLDSLYKGAFSHALGHSVGLYIHESPNLSPRNHTPLKSGTVITVEPGVYLEGNTGVRIEDLTVVRDGGCEILSKSSKELIIL